MQDPIVIYHPDLGGATATVEREYYRRELYFSGWRSNQDPYSETSYPPGSEITSVAIESDLGTINSSTVPVEFSSTWRLTVPNLNQPVYLELHAMISSVTTVSDIQVGFIPVANLANSVAFKGLRKYFAVPIGSTGIGFPISLRYRIPPTSSAGSVDWTLAGLRDGTGTGIMRGHVIYGSNFRAMAA